MATRAGQSNRSTPSAPAYSPPPAGWSSGARRKGTFHATDAETGEDLWTYNVGTGIHAPPVTYAIDGEQYIALAAGWGGWVKGFAPEFAHQPPGHTLITFRLPQAGSE